MERRQLTPSLPSYESGQRFLQIIDGVRESQYKSMREAIYKHIGNPQNPVDWNNPEEWIPARLCDDEKNQDLALRLWRCSDGLVNPRYVAGPMYLCTIHQLLSVQSGVLRVTELGEKFVVGSEQVKAKIDSYEGMTLTLQEIADKGPTKRREVMKSFAAYCHEFTTLSSYASINMAHSSRIRHLRERSFIEKKGHSYQITDSGLEYLSSQRVAGEGDRQNSGIAVLVNSINTEVRQQLREFLQNMNPYLFEHLIKLLLEEMNFEKVKVTSAVNDKGVDVLAEIELGISRVREVIQVKRVRGSVGRPILDLLRGSLYRFDAVRGTIITTGKFSKGANDAAFDKGAAPITLIDGERLLDLLIEHNIGIRKREIRIFEFDGDSLSQFVTEDEIDI